MDVLEWHFAFHPRTSLRQAWIDKRWSMFGHVSAYGYTQDETWVFFNPAGDGTKIRVTHHRDDVTALIAREYNTSWSILRTPPLNRKIHLPFHPHMNCATQCAHLVGVRAYLPQTLHRILRENGAEELHDEKPQT